MLTRKEFIANTCAHAIVSLGPNAHPTDFPSAVDRAIKVANILEQRGEAPWDLDQTIMKNLMLQAQAAQLTLVPAGGVAGSAAASQAEENTRRLMANIPPGTQLASVQAQGVPQAAPGTMGNPVQSGAVIASMGEVQGTQESKPSVVVNPPNIIPAFPNAG